MQIRNGARIWRRVRLNPDGSLDTDFLSTNAGANNNLYDMDVPSGGKILIGGEFNTYNGVLCHYIARIWD